jgi:hypothetical protein
MATKIERLSPLAIAKAKLLPGQKHRMLCDGGGLWLRLGPNGSKSWVFRFMIAGRAREMGLGGFDTLSAADAR